MLGQHGVDVLDAGRVYVDLWVAGQRDQGAESSSVRRRLSALSSFYRYCAAHDLAGQVRLWVRRGLAGLLPGARSFRPGGFPRPGIFPGAGSGDYSIADLAGLFTVSRPTHRHRLQLDLPRMDHRPARPRQQMLDHHRRRRGNATAPPAQGTPGRLLQPRPLGPARQRTRSTAMRESPDRPTRCAWWFRQPGSVSVIDRVLTGPQRA